MLEDKEFAEEYKREFDKICASESLRERVKNLKPQKPRHVITPLKATIGTVAAAFMIFAAVNEYDFNPDTDGIISETVVSTQMPEAEFQAVGGDAAEEPLGNVTDKPAPDTKSVKTETAKAVNRTVPKTTPKTESAVPTAENVAAENSAVENEVAVLSDEGTAVRNSVAEFVPTKEIWTVAEYYEYIGADISQKIGGGYVGAGTLEFEIGSDGLPIDDTAVLAFSVNGGTVSVTVSKCVLFDASLSGTVSESGNGFNAYKSSGGVYYKIYAQGLEKNLVESMVNGI